VRVNVIDIMKESEASPPLVTPQIELRLPVPWALEGDSGDAVRRAAPEYALADGSMSDCAPFL
jgi:hypothetical protein